MKINGGSKTSIIIGTIVVLVSLGLKGYRIFNRNGANNINHTFSTTTLNTNVVAFDFSNILSQKLGGTETLPNGKTIPSGLYIVNPDGKTTRPASSYVEYVEKVKVKEISDIITQIKELKSTDETKEMIDLSLDYFTEVEKIYKTELVNLAKMIDAKTPKEEVNKFAQSLNEKYLPVLDAKKQKLLAVAIPYAEKNGLKVSNYPHSSISVQ